MASLRPLSVLLSSDATRIALLVLNRPLEKEVVKVLWPKAVFRACADGGSNRLYECMSEGRESFLPNIITGDFDSAHTSVLDYYKQKGVELIRTEDQDETDFTKCLRVVAERTKQVQFDCVLVLGSLGGRLDHTLASMNTLYQAQDLISQPVLLLSEGSLACLLNKGSHRLSVDTGLEDHWCGLIPVGGACSNVTSTGLKWNLDHQELKFGKLISTSNTYDGSPVVTIETDMPLIWTMGYRMT